MGKRIDKILPNKPNPAKIPRGTFIPSPPPKCAITGANTPPNLLTAEQAPNPVALTFVG